MQTFTGERLISRISCGQSASFVLNSKSLSLLREGSLGQVPASQHIIHLLWDIYKIATATLLLERFTTNISGYSFILGLRGGPYKLINTLGLVKVSHLCMSSLSGRKCECPKMATFQQMEKRSYNLTNGSIVII